jgi:hypothetical protein
MVQNLAAPAKTLDSVERGAMVAPRFLALAAGIKMKYTQTTKDCFETNIVSTFSNVN